MTTLSVAVVGSGPAGLYTAEALVKQAAALDGPCQVTVDVLDRLPTPYGLVRYGVAPDHPSIKSIAEYLRGRLLDERLGGVEPGRAGANDRDGQGGHPGELRTIRLAVAGQAPASAAPPPR